MYQKVLKQLINIIFICFFFFNIKNFLIFKLGYLEKFLKIMSSHGNFRGDFAAKKLVFSSKFTTWLIDDVFPYCFELLKKFYLKVSLDWWTGFWCWLDLWASLHPKMRCLIVCLLFFICLFSIFQVIIHFFKQ